MSKMKQCGLLLTALAAILCLLLVSTAQADNTNLGLFVFMDEYYEGETLFIYWNAITGADHYDCTVMNETTGDYLRPRAETNSWYECIVSNVPAGRLKIWVGAVDENGDVITHETTHVTVKEEPECNHRYNSSTGCCKYCGEECPHDSGYYEVDTNWYGVSISDTEHRITKTYEKQCKICRYVVQEGLTETSTGKHTLDANGDCTNCDYRAGCQHSETKLVERTRSVKAHNEEKHKVKIVYDLVCANANCGKTIEMGGDIRGEYEPHTFVDGKCTACGYSQYEPLSAWVSRSAATVTVGSGISGTCSASGGSGNYQYAWRAQCGSTVMDETDYSAGHFHSFGATQSGSWTLTVWVRDTVTGDVVSCTSEVIQVIDAPKECEHSAYTDVARATKEYIKLSDTKHTVRTTYDRVCNDCGKTIVSFTRDESEAHIYVNGNCTRCGASETTECPHSGMTSTEIKCEIRQIDSPTDHGVDITWKDVCDKCGATLNTTRTTFVKEAHLFDDSGVCRCGYAKPSPTCDHADTYKSFVSSSVRPVDSTRHVVTTVYQIKCTCGVVINDAHQEDAYFNHSFDGNRCLDCGYEKQTTSTTPEPAVCEVHGSEHVFDYTGYEAEHPHYVFKRCDCGQTYYTGDTRSVSSCGECEPVCSAYGGEHQFMLTHEVNCPHRVYKICKCGMKIYTDEDINQYLQLRYMESEYYESKDDNTHKLMSYQSAQYYCTLCDAIHNCPTCQAKIQESCSAPVEKDTYAHTYDGSGICTACYHLRPAEQLLPEERYIIWIDTPFYTPEGQAYMASVGDQLEVWVYDKQTGLFGMPEGGSLWESSYNLADLTDNVLTIHDSKDEWYFDINLSANGKKLAQATVYVPCLKVSNAEGSMTYTSIISTENMDSVDWTKNNVLVAPTLAVGNYKSYRNADGTTNVSFEVYNSSPVVYGIAVYDANGNKISVDLVMPHQAEDSLGAEMLDTFAHTGGIFNSKAYDEQHTEKTEFTLDIPTGGSIRIEQMNDSIEVLAANIAEYLLYSLDIKDDVESVIEPQVVSTIKSFKNELTQNSKDAIYDAMVKALTTTYQAETIEELLEKGLKDALNDGGIDGLNALLYEESIMQTMMENLLVSVEGATWNAIEDAGLAAIGPWAYYAKHAVVGFSDMAELSELNAAFKTCFVDESDTRYINTIQFAQNGILDGKIDEKYKHYMVFESEMPLLSEGSSAAYCIGTIPTNTTVEVLRSVGNTAEGIYLYVIVDGSNGYILVEGTDMVHGDTSQANSSAKYVLITDNAMFRQGPDAASDYLRMVYSGTRLEYLSTEGRWYKVVDENGQVGYVSITKATLE